MNCMTDCFISAADARPAVLLGMSIIVALVWTMYQFAKWPIQPEGLDAISADNLYIEWNPYLDD